MKNSSKIEKNTFIIIVYIFIIIMILIILGLLIWLGIWSSNRQNYYIPPQTQKSLVSVENIEMLKTVGDGNGIQQTPEACANSNTIWNSGKCVCAFPYIGPYCGRELHDPKYLEVSVENTPENVVYTSELLNGVSVLSFEDTQIPTKNFTFNNKVTPDPQSCTGLCSSNSSCKGIIFDTKGCSLITSNLEILPNAVIKTQFQMNPTIFMNVNSHVILDNKVIFYSGPKPIKYWVPKHEVVPTIENPTGYLMLNANIPISMEWVPERVINDSRLIGIWSNTPFPNITPQSISSLINNINIYIDRANSDRYNYALKLPDYILNSQIKYVVYVTKDNVQNLKNKYVIAQK